MSGRQRPDAREEDDDDEDIEDVRVTSRLLSRQHPQARGLERCSRAAGSSYRGDLSDSSGGEEEAPWAPCAHRRAAKAVLVAGASLGFAAALLKSPVGTVLRGHISTPAVQGLAASEMAEHWGEDCWAACGSQPGECKDFCGLGNACCRYGATKDPPVCHGIAAWGSLSFHTCVVPVNPVFVVDKTAPQALQHWGDPCWTPCSNRSGYCESYCGVGNACCRWGGPYDAPECHSITQWGSKETHTCVRPVDLQYGVASAPPAGVKVLNWGVGCLQSCGDTGYCPEFCGTGNACCKWNAGFQAPECSGITSYGTKDLHTCVAPVHALFQTAAEQAGVQHWGEDCSAHCDGGGLCQDFCGLGNACCRWQSTEDPPECVGITQWGAKDRYTCVMPANPMYQSPQAPPEGDVMNWGADCIATCEESGYCQSFCGQGNACCRFGNAFDKPECHGITAWGSKDRYTCVKPALELFQVAGTLSGAKVQNWGMDCWEACGGLAGACPDFCGIGNACCHFGLGGANDPPECRGVSLFGSKEYHTCVAPVDLALYVNHFSEDCWAHCNGAGYCEDWCGSGNACCKFGNGQDPQECKGISYFSTWATHTCVKVAGYHIPVPTAPPAGSCRPGLVHNVDMQCAKPDHAALMTFYLYHPTTDVSPMLRDAVLGNMEGVMWYLHRSIVGQCPRSNHVNRIIRYVVTVKNPAQFFNDTKRQFDKLEMLQDPSKNATLKDGMVVGCAVQPTTAPEYPSYEGAAMFQLPGGKGLGGECAAPDGELDCTWKASYAGEVRIDELSGIFDDFMFCKSGYMEYNWATDRGNGTNFWNFRNNATWNQRRLRYLQELFKMKYPNYPTAIGEPECDSGMR